MHRISSRRHHIGRLMGCRQQTVGPTRSLPPAVGCIATQVLRQMRRKRQHDAGAQRNESDWVDSRRGTKDSSQGRRRRTDVNNDVARSRPWNSTSNWCSFWINMETACSASAYVPEACAASKEADAEIYINFVTFKFCGRWWQCPDPFRKRSLKIPSKVTWKSHSLTSSAGNWLASSLCIRPTLQQQLRRKDRESREKNKWLMSVRSDFQLGDLSIVNAMRSVVAPTWQLLANEANKCEEQFHLSGCKQLKINRHTASVSLMCRSFDDSFRILRAL